MLNNDRILWGAMEQSARECGCQPEDFLRQEPVLLPAGVPQGARAYLKDLPLPCDLVSYGSNVVAIARPELLGIVEKYIRRCSAAHCFETPNLHLLNTALAPFDLGVCFMAEYFLPDMTALQATPCGYEIRCLEGEELARLDAAQWPNALSADRRWDDRLAMAAFDGGQIIGLAGCSADCPTMWQIGIDVLPQYRRQGIAAALTSRLALAIARRDIIPFYCAAWSNLPSVRNALRCGFRPAWVQMTAKPLTQIAGMNGGALELTAKE